MGTATPLAWSVVIPVKVLAVAKTRLTGLADADRQALVLAMAADTVAAAMACGAVSAVVVVSDDPSVRAEADALGATVIGDEPASGLNPALEAGARYAAQHWPGRGLAALTADLPALSAIDLHTALTAASAVPQAFVPDAAGSGTTLYAASPAADFRPRFGPRSSARHRRAGAFEIALPVFSGLRRDVDTLADFAAAERIGLGRRSAAVGEALPTA
jgi:2-phospho-L-lactate guanylyltransferase